MESRKEYLISGMKSFCYENISRVRLKVCLQYLLLTLVIISGQSLWMRIYYRPDWLTNITIVLLLILFVLICLEKKIYKSSIYLIGMYTSVILFYFLFNISSWHTLLARIFAPLVMFTIYLDILWKKDEIKALYKKYVRIVIVLASVSLFLYIFGGVLNIIPSFEVTYYWADNYKTAESYFHLMYEAQNVKFLGNTFVRNCGIFCEAPSYAIPLSIALFYEWFIAEKSNNKIIVILILTVITTFSTKAILLVLVMVFFKLFKKIFISSNNQKNKIIVSILMLIVLLVALLVLHRKIVDDYNSFSQRFDNIYVSLLAFKDHMFFGVGIGDADAVSSYSQLSIKRYGFSMGAPLLLAEGGVYFTFFYLSAFVNALLRSKDKLLVFFIGIFVFSILFMSNIVYFPLIMLVLALGFTIPKKLNDDVTGDT